MPKRESTLEVLEVAQFIAQKKPNGSISEVAKFKVHKSSYLHNDSV